MNQMVAIGELCGEFCLIGRVPDMLWEGGSGQIAGEEEKFFHLPSTFSMILGVLPSIMATAELVVPEWIRVKKMSK